MCLLLTGSLAVAVGQRQRVHGVNLSLAVGTQSLMVLLASILNRHLAELSCEVWRALALVPGTALPPVYTWQVAHH